MPDVYHGAPTAMTLFIGSAPKIAAFAFVIRILGQGLESQVSDWRGMLVILAVLSMALGNIAAIAQSNLKRMLAYSTISHMGFMLLGILAGSQNGYGGAMFYVLAYALMSLGGFGMILLLSRAGFEADRLEDFKGLNRRSPWLAFMMLLLMFSMAGVPPTVGFYAKLSVLQAVVEIGYVWLAVAAVLFSLIGAFYYLRIVKLMYFAAPHDAAPIAASPDARVVMSINGLAILALGIMPQPLMAVCIHAIRASFWAGIFEPNRAGAGLLRRYLAFRIHREFLDYPAADPGVHRCQPAFPHRADLLRHTAQSRREKFCLAADGTGGAVFRGGGHRAPVGRQARRHSASGLGVLSGQRLAVRCVCVSRLRLPLSVAAARRIDA